jgi:2-oxo-4-hydroxy-4-carboxy--5-ureidoimidazoline (OHCU) decarboxylase
MAKLHPVNFADKLNADERLREKFIRAYVDYVVENMDRDDIISAFADQLWDNTERDIRENGADGIVEEAVYYFPDLMTDQFDVIAEQD